jgi:hypothetical protein
MDSAASIRPHAIELPSGSTMRHRYRLILHSGSLPAAQIEAAWDAYASSGD